MYMEVFQKNLALRFIKWHFCRILVFVFLYLRTAEFPSKKLRFYYALPPKILHTYSIDTPYIVHSFDGVSMEN